MKTLFDLKLLLPDLSFLAAKTLKYMNTILEHGNWSDDGKCFTRERKEGV
jgi:hypothetical protein